MLVLSVSFMMLTTLCFTFELFGMKCRACICLESMNSIPKGFRDVIQQSKGFVSVHS